jgi:voltage-gated sodium channel
LASAYFVSFILIGTMIMLNLFTGVIIRSMEEAEETHKHQREHHEEVPPQREELLALSTQLQDIAHRLAVLDQAGPRAPPWGR